MRFNGEKYKQIMKAKNLKVKDICRLTGLSEKSFSWLMENGFCEACTLECLADAVDCNASEISLPDINNSENCIEFLRDAKRATVTLTQGRYITKVKKLAEKHPDKCQIVAQNKDGSILAHIPVSWVKISPPQEMSEERKEEARQRMKDYHSKRVVTSC